MLIDMCGRWTETERIDAADRAICAGIASRPVLHQRAQQMCRGRLGVSTLVHITAPGADGVFWSALERLFGANLAGSGLPMPRFNAPLRYRGRLFYVDALWEAEDLAVELRGLQFHSARADRLRDDERANVFTQVGLRPLVFGWRDVRETFDEVAGEIRMALGPNCVTAGAS